MKKSEVKAIIKEVIQEEIDIKTALDYFGDLDKAAKAALMFVVKNGFTNKKKIDILVSDVTHALSRVEGVRKLLNK